MILSAISDSSRLSHINQGLWESCCKALGYGGRGGGQEGVGVGSRGGSRTGPSGLILLSWSSCGATPVEIIL